MQLYLSIAIQGNGAKALEVVVHFQDGAVGHGDTVGAERIVARAFEVAGIDGPSAVVGVGTALEIIRQRGQGVLDGDVAAAGNIGLENMRARRRAAVVQNGIAGELNLALNRGAHVVAHIQKATIADQTGIAAHTGKGGDGSRSSCPASIVRESPAKVVT